MASFGAYLERHASVPSTMPMAHALAARVDIPSGAAVWADEQTAGRGRAGRKWESAAGRSLMVSFMLRHAEHPIPLNRLVMVAALATAAACRSTGIDPERIGCKWPNDIVIFNAEGAPRKVAGILIETQLSADGWQHAVLGIGINVNHLQHELPQVGGVSLPPVSLRLALAEEQADAAGEPPQLDRDALFTALCSAFDWFETLSDDEIIADWRKLLWMPDAEVTIGNQGNEIARGWLKGVDDAGNLLIRDAAGAIQTFESGDLSLRVRSQ